MPAHALAARRRAGGREVTREMASSWVRRLGGHTPRGKAAWAVVAAGLAVIAVVAVASSGSAAPRQPTPQAKNFTLSTLGQPGGKVSLAALAGRPVIVNFFASWCEPCKRETPLLAGFYRQARGSVQIIGIDANDEAGPAERFVRQAGVRYPVAADPYPALVTTSYRVYGLPQTFFLDARHRIVKHVLGALTLAQLKAGVALMDSDPPGMARTRAAP
jgi:cytochrome c biogenesis protein CcmG/thiol:disulfide interchange protein DsbE